MRDIYKPGEGRNKLIDVKKKDSPVKKEKVKDGLPQIESENFWKPKHKKSRTSKVLWTFFFLVVFLALGLGGWYYFYLMPKNTDQDTQEEVQDPKLYEIDKKIEELEESQNNLDDFSLFNIMLNFQVAQYKTQTPLPVPTPPIFCPHDGQ